MGFISSRMPCKVRTSIKRVSKVTTEHVTVVEIAPLSKHDLVPIPSGKGGRIRELAIVVRLSSSIHLLNPLTATRTEIRADKYFANPLQPALTSTHLLEFIVLDIQNNDMHHQRQGMRHKQEVDYEREGTAEFEDLLVDVEVARVSDFGVNDITFIVRSHLGLVLKIGTFSFIHSFMCYSKISFVSSSFFLYFFMFIFHHDLSILHVLATGDTVMGYDLKRTVLDESVSESLESLGFDLQDIILVHKMQGNRKVKTKPERASKKGLYRRKKHGERVHDVSTEHDIPKDTLFSKSRENDDDVHDEQEEIEEKMTEEECDNGGNSDDDSDIDYHEGEDEEEEKEEGGL